VSDNIEVTPGMQVEASEIVHGVPATQSHGQLVLHPSRQQYLELVSALKSDGYNMCVDLCAVDYLGFKPNGRISWPTPEGTELGRFEIVVNLLSHANRERVRIRVQVPEADATLPSLFDLYRGTEAMEREAFDMFGIVFVGHPDLTRILMPEDWEGHPLRKDYAIGRVPVQFKAAAPTR
jgi:NADH-quinone oxidoreductase subunit C